VARWLDGNVGGYRCLGLAFRRTRQQCRRRCRKRVIANINAPAVGAEEFAAEMNASASMRGLFWTARFAPVYILIRDLKYKQPT